MCSSDLDFVACRDSNAMFVHAYNSGHSIDFDHVIPVIGFTDSKARRVIESSFIKCHSESVMNQNSGLNSFDRFTAICILNSIKGRFNW